MPSASNAIITSELETFCRAFSSLATSSSTEIEHSLAEVFEVDSGFDSAFILGGAEATIVVEKNRAGNLDGRHGAEISV